MSCQEQNNVEIASENNLEITTENTLDTKVRARIVTLCSVVYFISYFSRKDFAAAMAAMITDGMLDKMTGGYIGMGMFIAYGVGQLISGYLGDRIKPRTLLLAGVGTTAVCNLLMPFVPAVMMIPVWTVNGLAQAMLWPPIVRILADTLDSASFVRANLIVTSAAHVATVLLYVYVPFCIGLMSWEAVFYTASVLALLGFLIILLQLNSVLRKAGVRCNPHKAVAKVKKSGVSMKGYFKLVLSAGIVPIFLCIIMMGFLRDGIETWLPTLYCEAFEREASESIFISGVLPIFSIFSISAITVLHTTKLFANEARGSAVLFAISALITVGLYFIIENTDTLSRLLCLVLVAFVAALMHGCNFLLISCMPGRFASYGKAATTSGFSNACTYIGAAISMYGIPSVAEAFGWRATVGSWIAVAALGLVAALIAMRAYTSFLKHSGAEN